MYTENGEREEKISRNKSKACEYKKKHLYALSSLTL